MEVTETDADQRAKLFGFRLKSLEVEVGSQIT